MHGVNLNETFIGLSGDGADGWGTELDRHIEANHTLIASSEAIFLGQQPQPRVVSFLPHSLSSVSCSDAKAGVSCAMWNHLAVHFHMEGWAARRTSQRWLHTTTCLIPVKPLRGGTRHKRAYSAESELHRKHDFSIRTQGRDYTWRGGVVIKSKREGPSGCRRRSVSRSVCCLHSRVTWV